MRQHADEGFSFGPDVPIDPVPGGTNLLVTGPSASGAREVALQLLVPRSAREGTLLLSTDVGGQSLLQRYEGAAGYLERSRIGVVDCTAVEDEQRRFTDRLAAISDPGDLTGIEIEFSGLYETLRDRDLEAIRIGVFSLTSLLSHGDFRSVSRFVHVLTGRVIATDDFAVFVADADLQDEREIDTIAAFCDGRVDVRCGADDGMELRVSGLDTHSDTWTPVSRS